MNNPLFTYLFRKFCPWLIFATSTVIVWSCLDPKLWVADHSGLTPLRVFSVIPLILLSIPLFKIISKLNGTLAAKGFSRQTIARHLLMIIAVSYLLFVVSVSLFLLSPIRSWLMSFSDLAPFVHYYPGQEILNLIDCTLFYFVAYTSLYGYLGATTKEICPWTTKMVYGLWISSTVFIFTATQVLSPLFLRTLSLIIIATLAIPLSIRNFYNREYSS